MIVKECFEQGIVFYSKWFIAPIKQYHCVIFGKHDPLANEVSYDHQVLWSSNIVSDKNWDRLVRVLAVFTGFVIFSGEYSSQSSIRIVGLYLFQSYHFEINHSWKKLCDCYENHRSQSGTRFTSTNQKWQRLSVGWRTKNHDVHDKWLAFTKHPSI